MAADGTFGDEARTAVCIGIEQLLQRGAAQRPPVARERAPFRRFRQ
jgi:hypothetical protein